MNNMTRMENPTYMQPSNAFTPVSVRRTFANVAHTAPGVSAAHPIVPMAPPAPEKVKREWPESVRAYVQRAFATDNEAPGVARQEMEARLKKVISQSAESNTLFTLDWATVPLPQQMILNERGHHTKLAPNPSWAQASNSHTLRETNFKVNESTPKKRKSSEMDNSQATYEKIPPWQQANTRNVFEDRISFPDKRPRNDTNGKSSKSEQKMANRKRRFDDNYSPNAMSTTQPPPQPVDQGPVVGRCQILEKKYFRLTSAPNPDTVRPLHVLHKTLDLLKRKWKTENNYSYICDQFKSLRQDLTVQHIKTEFTVSVYEIHARIALEKGDLGEYNQCQTQLRALYSQQLGGHPEEFKAYRILYFIHTCNRTDMNDVLADLTSAEKSHPAIKHALQTRSALALGNYHRFFRLYLDTPNMGAYLMDMFVTRERLAALSNICVS